MLCTDNSIGNDDSFWEDIGDVILDCLNLGWILGRN